MSKILEGLKNIVSNLAFKINIAFTKRWIRKKQIKELEKIKKRYKDQVSTIK